MSVFRREIEEQPAALQTLAARYRDEGRDLLKAVAEICSDDDSDLLCTGMGSSAFAAQVVPGWLLEVGCRTSVWDAGELLHYGSVAVTPSTVLMAISQSGESAETARVAEILERRRALIAVTNRPESSLGRRADITLPLHAGVEAAISTKTYTNTLAVMWLLAGAVNGCRIEAACADLELAAGAMSAVKEQLDPACAAVAADLARAPCVHFVGRGPALTAARQGALVFSEGARIPTCALSGGSFRHGPLEMVGADTSVVLLAPAGATCELIMDLAADIRDAGGTAILITNSSVAGNLPEQRHLRVPPTDEALFPLPAAVVLELLLYHVAHARGSEAGVFEHISKVTRRE